MEIPQWIIWIGGSIATVLSLFGVAKIVEMMLGRFFARRDRRQDITDTNNAKLIDADQEALKLIIGELQATKARVDVLETKLEKINKDHTSLMIENAKLKSDAEHAEKEMERQAKEITSLRDRNHKLAGDIQNRDTKIASLETRIVQLESMLQKSG